MPPITHFEVEYRWADNSNFLWTPYTKCNTEQFETREDAQMFITDSLLRQKHRLLRIVKVISSREVV